MSEVQDNQARRSGTLAGGATAPDHASGLLAAANGDDGEDTTADEGDELGGHTMLARAAAPQGRRTLFRR